MSRAIKLKNNDYLDSTGVVYNRTSLNTILSRKTTGKNNGKDTSTTVTPTFDCKILVITASRGWGYGGGTSELQITTPSGLTLESSVFSTVTGNDLYSRPQCSFALFSGAKAGVSYTFYQTRTNNGSNTSDGLMVLCLPF